MLNASNSIKDESKSRPQNSAEFDETETERIAEEWRQYKQYLEDEEARRMKAINEPAAGEESGRVQTTDDQPAKEQVANKANKEALAAAQRLNEITKKVKSEKERTSSKAVGVGVPISTNPMMSPPQGKSTIVSAASSNTPPQVSVSIPPPPIPVKSTVTSKVPREKITPVAEVSSPAKSVTPKRSPVAEFSVRTPIQIGRSTLSASHPVTLTAPTVRSISTLLTPTKSSVIPSPKSNPGGVTLDKTASMPATTKPRSAAAAMYLSQLQAKKDAESAAVQAALVRSSSVTAKKLGSGQPDSREVEAAREQAAREQATREQAAREQAAREAETKARKDKEAAEKAAADQKAREVAEKVRQQQEAEQKAREAAEQKARWQEARLKYISDPIPAAGLLRLSSKGPKETETTAAIQGQMAKLETQVKADSMTIANLQKEYERLRKTLEAQEEVLDGKSGDLTDELIRVSKVCTSAATRIKVLLAQLAYSEQERNLLCDKSRTENVAIAELEAQLQVAKSNDLAVEAQVSDLEAKVTDLEVQAKKDADTIAALKKQLAEVNASKAVADKRIHELQLFGKKDSDEIDDLRRSVAQMKASEQQWERQTAEMKAQHTKDVEELMNLRGQQSEMRANFNTLKKQLDESKATESNLQKRITELEAQSQQTTRGEEEIATSKKLFAETSYLKIRIAELEGELKASEAKVSALTSQATTEKEIRDKRISELEALSKKDADEIAALKKQLAELKTAADKRIAELEAQSETKEESDDHLKAKNLLVQIAEEKTAADKRIAELSDQLKRSETLYEELKQRSTELAKAKIVSDKRVAELEAQSRKDADEIVTSKKLLEELEQLKAAADAGQNSANSRSSPTGDAGISGSNGATGEISTHELQLQVSKDKNDVLLGGDDDHLQQELVGAKAAKTLSDQLATQLESQMKIYVSEVKQQQATIVDLKQKLTSASVELANVTAAKAAAEKRIAELEEAARHMSIETADLHAQQSPKTAHKKNSESLKTRLDELADAKAATDKRNAQLEAQVKGLLAEIDNVKRRLADFLVHEKKSDDLFKERVGDIKVVNDWLLRLSQDATVQQALKRPKVQKALDMWGGASLKLSEQELEDIKWDEGVMELYPQLKEFEKVCDEVKIKFPVDHIQASKTELSEEAVTYAFGPDFVAKQQEK